MGPNEDLLWEGRPSGFLYFPGPVLFLILVVVLNVYLLNHALGGWNGYLIPVPSWFPASLTTFSVDSPQVMIGIALLLIAVIYLAARWYQRATTVFAVTSTRLIRQKGIVSKDFDEIQLRQIRGIDVKQSLLQRMFGYGTVQLSAEGGGASAMGNEKWEGFPHPVRFQRTVETAQERTYGVQSSGSPQASNANPSRSRR